MNFIENLIAKLKKDQLKEFLLYETVIEKMHESELSIDRRINCDWPLYGEWYQYPLSIHHGNKLLEILKGKGDETGFKDFLDDISKTTNLKKLDLNSCELTDYHASMIADYISQNKIGTIETINLSCNNFSKEGLKKLIEAYKQNTSLKKLDIRPEKHILGTPKSNIEELHINLKGLEQTKTTPNNWKIKVCSNEGCKYNSFEKM